MKYPIFETLRNRGWMVTLRVEGGALLRAEEVGRYPQIPVEAESYLASIEECCSADETCWFLGYGRNAIEVEADDGFRRNAFELMRLAGLSADDPEREHVGAFWDQHLPFMFAVHPACDFLAIQRSSPGFGSVVPGYAPEFECEEPVASSFSEFLEKFRVVAQSDNKDWPLSLFLGNGENLE